MPQSANYAINKLTLTVFWLSKESQNSKVLNRDHILKNSKLFFLPFCSLDETELSMEPPSSLFEKNLRCNNWL